jgi:hypothetical protein
MRLGLRGGIGDKLRPSMVNQEELNMGIKMEQEHIKNNQDISQKVKDQIAEDIALDHLAEIPDYYTRLKKMEEEAKKELHLEDDDQEKAAAFTPYFMTKRPIEAPADSGAASVKLPEHRYPDQMITCPNPKDAISKIKIKARRKRKPLGEIDNVKR